MHTQENIDKAFIAAQIIYGITHDAITSPTRNACVTRARHALCYLLSLEGYTYVTIARIVNRKHHTTIMSAVRRCKNIIKTDPYQSMMFEQLESEYKAHKDYIPC